MPARSGPRAGLAAFTLCLLALFGLYAPPAAAVDWTYTVRPGDSPWSIARRFCREKTCWRRVAPYNGLAANALPRAGQRLRIPVELLARQPIHATAAAITGAAYLVRRHQADAPLTEGARLYIDDRIRTFDGTVTVRFADDSEVVIGPNSELLFDMLGAFGDGGMVDTQVRALRGRVEPRVRPRPGGSSFRIVTPTGTAVVRGTEFRIRAEGASFAELTKGALAFGDTALAPGFGLVTRADAPPPPPEALLPAPRLRPSSLVGSTPLTIAWDEVPGAQGYRVLLFAARAAHGSEAQGDGEHAQEPADSSTPGRRTSASSTSAASGAPATLLAVRDAPTNALRLDLGPGRYDAVVRAIAASGLEGLDGRAPVQVRVAAPRPHANADGSVQWAPVEGAGLYEVQLARDAAFTRGRSDVSSTTPNLTPTLAPGRTWLRVRAVGAQRSYSAAGAGAGPGAGPGAGAGAGADEGADSGAGDYGPAITLDRAPTAITLTARTRSWNTAAWRLAWSQVPGARYRLQVAPDDRFAGEAVTFADANAAANANTAVREIVTELRSWSLECPFTRCSVRVRAEYPAAHDDAVAGPWSATVPLDASPLSRVLAPRMPGPDG